MGMLLAFLISLGGGIALDRLLGLFPLMTLMGIALWLVSLFKRMNRKV